MQPIDTAIPLLGDLSPAQFMRDHWHKRMRVIRGAIPAFSDLLTPNEIMKLATNKAVESRLILKEGKTWKLEHGPFKSTRWKLLPKKNWTLLVQGLNLHLPAADELLRKFSFIAHARLDDLMVSLAAPGGGVGPHFDSYDVFLLQGMGIRRWALSEQTDLELIENAPLKLLKRMQGTQTHDLVAGDMLYLPPQVAHDGVAAQTDGYCTTYSIGFRAPTNQEIVDAFAHWVTDTTEVEGRLSDPSLTATSTPGKIPDSYLATFKQAITAMRIDDEAIAQFAGCFATEPKPSISFEPPEKSLSRAQFATRAAKQGIALHPAALCLYDHKHLFINGEAFELLGDAAFWHSLADARECQVPSTLANETLDALYDWYCEGWVSLRAVSG